MHFLKSAKLKGLILRIAAERGVEALAVGCNNLLKRTGIGQMTRINTGRRVEFAGCFRIAGANKSVVPEMRLQFEDVEAIPDLSRLEMIEVGHPGAIACGHGAQEGADALAGAAEGEVLLVSQQNKTTLFKPALAGVVPGQVQMGELGRGDGGVLVMGFAKVFGVPGD